MEVLIDNDELRDSARRVLERHVDRKTLLGDPCATPSFDRHLWQLIAELGWLGLTIAEGKGGLEQPFAALSTLYFELGRALSPQPFLGASVGLEIIAHPGATDCAAGLVQAALQGDAIIVAAATGVGSVTCRPYGGVHMVEGTMRNVLDAVHATHLLVPVEGNQAAIALVALPHPGVDITYRPTWDPTRQVADVAFRELELYEDDIILRGDAAVDAQRRMNAHFDLALACDALGGADAALEGTLVYMHQRHQFNRPIASFQALKHRCAEHKVSIEAARALIHSVCRSAFEAKKEGQAQAAGARIYAGSVYRSLTEDCVQLHGGIGFTWEYPCHLFLKRARSGEVLGGTAEQRKDRVAPALFTLCHRERR
ncbi:acyl-CoA dehydrogenase (plasmid) [Cupriavidus necator N-1]|uniref:Acyl-CoA dehydrogenase n=1 Tax=Cupriavidus necator (strain ATCC 43291 / DSM 13513 / CCUG 52238 / LMG 8453 / N-1) TaxID=1042878 RepID=F8GWY0_CUPNN|nr:acyl-CoA dehydrogenase [Cupriavidus necator N-1]